MAYYESIYNVSVAEKLDFFEPSEEELTLIQLEDENQASESELEEIMRDSEKGIIDSVKQYLREIATIKLLTVEEEQELGWRIMAGNQAAVLIGNCKKEEFLREYRKQIADGTDAQSELVNANLRLVVSIAKKYKSSGMDFLDLVQEGNCGLMKAAGKFDVSKGYRFSTYATWWIRQAIQRAIGDMGRIIRVPVHMQENLRRLNAVKNRLTHELGRDASIEELAEAMKIEKQKVKELLELSRDATSLDSPIGEDEDATLGAFIEDDTYPSPEKYVIQSNLKELLIEVLDSLPRKEATVLKYRYGFFGRVYTLQEVADIYNVSRERIRQIEKKAIHCLSHNPTKLKKLKELYAE